MVQLILTVLDYDDQIPIVDAVATTYEQNVATDGVTDPNGMVFFAVAPVSSLWIGVQKPGYDAVQLPLDTTLNDPTTWTVLLPKTNRSGFPWWLFALLGLGVVASSEEKKS